MPDQDDRLPDTPTTNELAIFVRRLMGRTARLFAVLETHEKACEENRVIVTARLSALETRAIIHTRLLVTVVTLLIGGLLLQAVSAMWGVKL